MSQRRDLILTVQQDRSLADGLTLALQRRGVSVVQARRWTQARLLLAGSPAIVAIIASCHLEADDGEPLLSWAERHHPSLTLVATCVSRTHDHAQLPPSCTVWRVPFDGEALDVLVAQAAATSE